MRIFPVLLLIFILVAQPVSAASESKYDSIMSVMSELPTAEIANMAMTTEASDDEKALIMWLIICHRLNGIMPDDEMQTISLAHLRAGNIHFARGNYANALELYVKGLKICEQSDSKKYIMRFYNNIGNVYSVFDEYEKSVNYYSKGLREAASHTDDTQTLYDILVNITGMCAYLKNTKDANLYYKRLIGLKGFDSPENIFMKNFDLSLIKKCENKPEESISILKKLADFAHEHNLDPRYECSAYEEIYKTYYSLGNYDSTLVYLDKCAALSSIANIQHMYVTLKKAYSDVYSVKGETAKALQFKSEYLNMKDSIYNQREFEVVKNQQFLYEIEQNENKIASMNAEKAHHMHIIKNQRMLIISILSGVVIAIVLLTVVSVQKRRLKISYQKLYIAHRSALNSQTTLTTVPKDTGEETQAPHATSGTLPIGQDNTETSSSCKYQGSNLSPEQKLALAEAITATMEQKQAYCSSGFSLEQLAAEVGSNTKYVSQVINEQFGKNFSNYVNEYRVRLICIRLLDKENYGHLTIKAISESVGFKSQSTFIKVFRNIIGMPPSMYQRLAKNDKNIADS